MAAIADKVRIQNSQGITINPATDEGLQSIANGGIKTITLIDEASSTITYFGFAVPGTATSAAGWRILRDDSSAAVEALLYAGGTAAFTNVWNNRAALSYS